VRTAQFRNKWRRGRPANPGSSEKMAIKLSVFVYVNNYSQQLSKL